MVLRPTLINTVLLNQSICFYLPDPYPWCMFCKLQSLYCNGKNNRKQKLKYRIPHQLLLIQLSQFGRCILKNWKQLFLWMAYVDKGFICKRYILYADHSLKLYYHNPINCIHIHVYLFKELCFLIITTHLLSAVSVK